MSDSVRRAADASVAAAAQAARADSVARALRKADGGREQLAALKAENDALKVRPAIGILFDASRVLGWLLMEGVTKGMASFDTEGLSLVCQELLLDLAKAKDTSGETKAKVESTLAASIASGDLSPLKTLGKVKVWARRPIYTLSPASSAQILAEASSIAVTQDPMSPPSGETG